MKHGIFLLSAALISFSGTARGWPTGDHRMLACQAIKHCPPELSSFLNENLEAVLRGSVDPDKKFMDTLNHTYEVLDGTRNNPDHVAYLSSKLISMMRNRAPRSKIAYWFGALSHYVSDISEPLHTSESDRGEWWYHPLFESLNLGFEVDIKWAGFEVHTKLGKLLSEHEFQYDGKYDSMEDVRAWQMENAREAHLFYGEIGRLFKKKHDLERLAEIYTTCLDRAGNNIIDLWVHVFQAAQTDLESLPRQEDVMVIDVDRKNRLRLRGERVKENEFRKILENSATPSPPSVYIELDDRCERDTILRMRKMCTEAGIEHVSTILVRKGSRAGRFARAARVHIKSLMR